MSFTRRQFSLQIASSIGLSSIALAAPQKQDNEISHTADAIHQEVNFSAEPKRIYDVLLDTNQFDEMTRLIPSMKTANLVQAWRVVDCDPGVYSIVKFELSAQGAGTRLVFDHTGFPVGLAKHLADGWKEHYWDPLQKYLT